MDMIENYMWYNIIITPCWLFGGDTSEVAVPYDGHH